MSSRITDGPYATWWQRCKAGWERFWFTSADPTLLGAIRICAGLIILYTFVAYTFTLQQFMGPNAWFDLQARMDEVHSRYIPLGPLNWDRNALSRPPRTQAESDYFHAYFEKWGDAPVLPY